MNKYVKFRDPRFRIGFLVIGDLYGRAIVEVVWLLFKKNSEKIVKFNKNKHPNDEISFLLWNAK